MFKVFFAMPASSIPAVRVAHGDHRREHGAPGVWLHHRVVGEHAAIPANVLKGARRLAVVSSEPGAGNAHDIHLSIRIVWKTMSAGLVMRAGSFHCGVVLRYVKIDRPRTQGLRH